MKALWVSLHICFKQQKLKTKRDTGKITKKDRTFAFGNRISNKEITRYTL